MALAQLISIADFGLLAQFDFGLLIMEVLLFGSSLFLILLILVQRGKGGGLTGALGGAGGQSAFGAKAGDAFTKITVITAVFWIMLCMVTIARFNPPPTAAEVRNNNATVSGDDESDTADSESVDGENAELPSVDLGTETDNPATTSQSEDNAESKPDATGDEAPTESSDSGTDESDADAAGTDDSDADKPDSETSGSGN